MTGSKPARWRAPELDLQKHIIDGKRVPRSGAGIPEFSDDDMLGRDDPMQFDADDGRFGPEIRGDVQAENRRMVAGLDAGMDGRYNGRITALEGGVWCSEPLLKDPLAETGPMPGNDQVATFGIKGYKRT